MDTADVRIDKWLWAVRVFKTRAQAAEACRGGHVAIAGQKVKASRTVRPGDLIVVTLGALTRTLKVVSPIGRRVGPKLVKDYLEDLTPPSEYQKEEERRRELGPRPIKGFGRPTKKTRRAMEDFFGGGAGHEQ